MRFPGAGPLVQLPGTRFTHFTCFTNTRGTNPDTCSWQLASAASTPSSSWTRRSGQPAGTSMPLLLLLRVVLRVVRADDKGVTGREKMARMVTRIRLHRTGPAGLRACIVPTELRAHRTMRLPSTCNTCEAAET